MEILLKGCVSAPKEDKEFLEHLGIIVGEYDEEQKEFKDCLVSEIAMRHLDPYFGMYVWSLFNEEDRIIDGFTDEGHKRHKKSHSSFN
jgi:hypothetical protein